MRLYLLELERNLIAEPGATSADCALEAAVRTVLDRRLQPSGPPVAVALSGGGDSLALTLIADGWARAHGRELLVLSVDHRLRPESIAWVNRCEDVATRLGRRFRALAWMGEKPAAGLPAAARDARHRLLADAARAAGAQVILMGHTADDVAETKVMRAAGSTTSDPREWRPSPKWPEGRGLFVLRPLLDQRRAALRSWLSDRGEAWIEDPANDDLRFARARARATGPSDTPSEEGEASLELARLPDHGQGAIRLDRQALLSAPMVDVIQFISLACVCAGGGERRPATARLRRVAEALWDGDAVVATLAGARVVADAVGVTIAREPGEFRRRGLPLQSLPPGREVVWDGRYAARAQRPGLTIRPALGLAARLGREDRNLWEATPAAERGGLPAIVMPDGDVRLAIGGGLAEDLTIECLVRARFEAAAGLVQREPATANT